MRVVFAPLILMAAMPAASAQPPADGYRSTIAEYTPYREAPMTDWRTANDTVRPMHGHMGHAQGKAAKPCGGGEAGSSPDQPGSMGMDGHHHHMGVQP